MTASETQRIPGRGRVIAGLFVGAACTAGVLPFDVAGIELGRTLEAAWAAQSPGWNDAGKQWTQAFGRIEGGIVSGVLLLLLGRRKRAGLRRVVTLALALLLIGAYVAAFKIAVGRARPGPALRATGSYETLIEGPAVALRDPQYRSFPSGHTASAAAAAAVVSAYHPALLPIGFSLTAIVAAERVYDAKHYPSDVVAGGFLGWWVGWYAVAMRARGLRMPWEAPEEFE
ncbi:MAG: phosphatase PAP2 family protein [Myxococcota bacterium]|nr:phosphatase PAP2 family protein [Myxococcota bacterium]